jgi:hypothetical protein
MIFSVLRARYSRHSCHGIMTILYIYKLKIAVGRWGWGTGRAWTVHCGLRGPCGMVGIEVFFFFSRPCVLGGDGFESERFGPMAVSLDLKYQEVYLLSCMYGLSRHNTECGLVCATTVGI